MELKEKRMITIKEASDWFSIGVKSMLNYAKQGEGEYAVYVGNRYMILPDKFERHLMKSDEKAKENRTEGIIRVLGMRFVSAKAAAKLFTIGEKRMRSLAEMGEGNFSIHFGDRWLVSPDRLEEYLLAHCREWATETDDED